MSELRAALTDVFVKPFVPFLLAYSEMLAGNRGMVRCVLAWTVILVALFVAAFSFLVAVVATVTAR